MVEPSRTSDDGKPGPLAEPARNSAPVTGGLDVGGLDAECSVAEAVERLVAEHHAVLYRYAFRLTGRQADAEDLTQQTFLQAQASLHQLREPSAARSWLFTILRNIWQRGCRQRTRLPLEPAEVDVNNIPQEVPDHPLDGEALQLALDELPETFKEVLLLFYFEDCSYKEIAEKTGLAPGTVMSRLSRAKDHLRKRLFVREFGTPEPDPSDTFARVPPAYGKSE